jgi:glucokinase
VVDYASLFRAAKAGDTLALEIREQSLQVWSALVVSLIHAYDPERVILGGGVMGSAEEILPAISHHVRRHAWTPWGTVEVAAAELGNDAGLIGITSLASECIKEPIT